MLQDRMHIQAPYAEYKATQGCWASSERLRDRQMLPCTAMGRDTVRLRFQRYSSTVHMLFGPHAGHAQALASGGHLAGAGGTAALLHAVGGTDDPAAAADLAAGLLAWLQVPACHRVCGLAG